MLNPRLDFTTLRIFAAVAGSQNISKAATRENIAVSAVSKRISDLEEMLGTKLLNRLPRGVEPTPAGYALLHHATAILRNLEQLEGDLSEYARGVKGHVHLMVNQSSLVEFLPEDLSTFVRQYPDIKIDLREGNSPTILRAVADGIADVGVFTTELSLPIGLEVYPYRTDSLALIMPRGHPLARLPSVRLLDVLEYDLIGLDVGSAWDTILTQAASALHGTMRIRFRVASFDAVCRLIGAGLGIGIAPPAMLSAFTSAASLVAVTLDEPWAERQLALCVRELAVLPASVRLMVRHLAQSKSRSEGND